MPDGADAPAVRRFRRVQTPDGPAYEASDRAVDAHAIACRTLAQVRPAQRILWLQRAAYHGGAWRPTENYVIPLDAAGRLAPARPMSFALAVEAQAWLDALRARYPAPATPRAPGGPPRARGRRRPA